MRKPIKFFVAVLMLFTLFSCAGKRVKLDPGDPLFKDKNELYSRYGFWVSDEELKVLVSLPIVEAVDKFKEEFWKMRDTDPSTPENEYKNLIDGRIKDIENEIFATDLDIPLTRFDRNGGLKGDMAHVYLFYGMPHYKAKLSEGIYHVELMTWYYFDADSRVLMRFLFYEKYGKFNLFRNYGGTIFDLEYALKDISKMIVTSPREYEAVWEELWHNDVERVFISALMEFSSYTDVVIEGGNDKRFGALDVPEPAALTAKRFKPTVLGQPADLEGREFIFSSYHSFIPASFDIATDSATPNHSFSITLAYANLDWEVKDKEAEAILDLRISFQNKGTRALGEFATGIVFKGPRQAIESLIRQKGTRTVRLDSMLNWAGQGKPQLTLRQLVDDELAPGEYIVNVYLKHSFTKKYNAWREEITIK